MTKMLAFHNKPAEKKAILAQLKAHYDADEIIHGVYWEKGKGCAVGCTIHSNDHALYESRFGIPQMLAHLEDRIFEGMGNGRAKEWPLQFMRAIKPGADLSKVGWKFLHWLLTDESINPGINHPLVKDAVKQCADVLVPLTKGKPIDKAMAAAEAWAAARAAALARAAAAASNGPAWAALAAEAAADAAVWAADASAWASAWASASAWAAAGAVGPAAASAYGRMADKLLALLRAAR